jgi:hypothetical protein
MQKREMTEKEVLGFLNKEYPAPPLCEGIKAAMREQHTRMDDCPLCVGITGNDDGDPCWVR